ncbi:class I SAM-dependent methyltransferase, partial [Streptomyces sporangiiformans]
AAAARSQRPDASRPVPARSATVSPAARRSSRTRRIAKDLLPPIVTRALVKRRRARG